MKKILKSFLGMLVVVITLSFLTSCLTQTPGVATLTYKKDAQEKMEYYSDWDGCINQAKEDIEMYDHACSFFSILKEMIEYNPDKTILLAGIDCYASREEKEADK